MKSKLIILSLIAILLGACAGNNQVKENHDGDILLQPVAIGYPQSVGHFSLVKQEQNGDPAIGRVLTYESSEYDDLFVTVYAYFQGLFATVDEAVAAQAEQLLHEFEVAEEADLYTLGDILSSEIIQLETKGKSHTGFRHFFELTTPEGVDALSVADVFYLPPYFVKIRATFPGFGNRSYQQKIQEFEHGLLPDMRIGESIRCDQRLRVSPAETGEEWVSVEGRLLVLDTDKDRSGNEEETTVDELFAMPMIVALQRQAERKKDCEK